VSAAHISRNLVWRYATYDTSPYTTIKKVSSSVAG